MRIAYPPKPVTSAHLSVLAGTGGFRRLPFLRELAQEPILALAVTGHDGPEAFFSFALFALCQDVLDDSGVLRRIGLRQHLPQRFEALPHLTQRDNSASVVALGFRLSE